MMYGKLVDGELHGAPNPIRTEDEDIFTNDPQILLQHGYKPIILTDAPDIAGKTYVASWEETDSAITEVWTEVIYSDSDEIPADEALKIIAPEESK